jgi:hypothetical protein
LNGQCAEKNRPYNFKRSRERKRSKKADKLRKEMINDDKLEKKMILKFKKPCRINKGLSIN